MREIQRLAVVNALNLVVVAVLLAGTAANIWAGQSGDVRHKTPFSQEEYESLPRYCWASNMIHKSLSRPLLSDGEREQWYRQMGNDFIHIHHWCWALMQMRRGNQTADALERDRHYRTAIGNIDYVIRNAKSTFPLKPEFHLRKGMILRMMEEDAAAAVEFANSIQLKPDYTPAYSALVDLHVDLGNVDEALRLLEIGLARAPNSEILATMKQELERRDVGPSQEER